MTNLEIFGIIKARRGPKPQGDLSGVIDGSIQTLEIPSVSSIRNYAFYYCTSLTSVTIPESVTSIGQGAFENCSSLTSVTIPKSVPYIIDYTFCDCTSLTSIKIPDSVTSIGRWAFSHCTSLTSIAIPNRVIWIGERAFEFCSSLTSIEMPNSIISIGNWTFTACSSLENVTFEEDFQCNGLNLSASTKFSVDTMIAMFNALADRTGLSAYTLILGNTNLAKLSNEQIAIATEKNWTLA